METTEKTAKFADQITPDQLKTFGVSTLSNTPNRSQYGTEGLSAEELKKRFDKLVTLAIDRINSILAVLEGDKFELAERIDIGIEGIATLKDLADAVTNGTLYNKLMDKADKGSTLSGIIDKLSTDLAKLRGNTKTDLATVESALDKLRGTSEQSLSDLENTINDAVQNLNIDISNLRTNNDEAHEKINIRITTAENGASAAYSLAQDAQSIALGANQAKAFPNYKWLIDHLNSASEDLYKTGQNLYIQTREVPDLWVSGVSSEYVRYEYSSAGTVDKEFLYDLQNDNVVRVGHYRISALETQKVDLTEYYTKSETDAKFLKIPDYANAGGWTIVPNVNKDGRQRYEKVSSIAAAGVLVRRTDKSQIKAPDQSIYPPADDEYISKQYFEANKGGGGKLYKHTLDVSANYGYDAAQFSGTFIFINSDPNPTVTDEIQYTIKVNGVITSVIGHVEDMYWDEDTSMLEYYDVGVAFNGYYDNERESFEIYSMSVNDAGDLTQTLSEVPSWSVTVHDDVTEL